LSIESFEKVATPLEAETVLVPLKVPEDGFVPIASVTDAEEEVTTLPFASRTSTFTAGVMAEPAVVFDGWTLKATRFAAPGVMLNVELVAPVRPVLEAASV